jgi:hypothetical protein
LQNGDAGKVNLPEDDPTIVSLLINYMYECEYEPKLPDVKVFDEVLSRVIVTGVMMEDTYNYEFPHTCENGCPEPHHAVCQHHVCGIDTCKDTCNNFVCKHCCPGYFGVRLPPDGDANQLLLHSKMYQMGDKYDVAGLKDLAREKFLRSCTEHWNSEYFAPAAQHAFSTTIDGDMGLREIIINLISEHMRLLNKPEVVALLDEFSGLAVGLLKKRAKDLGWISDEKDEKDKSDEKTKIKE